MNRAILALLAIVLGYWEFRDDLAYWLPAVGSLDSGYVLAQTLVLAFLAAIIFGTVISLSYRFMAWFGGGSLAVRFWIETLRLTKLCLLTSV